MSEKQSYRDSDDMPTERAVLEREWKAMRLALSTPRAALAAQPGSVGLTDEQIKRHSLLAADCPGASTVILVSSLRRLLAAAPTEAKPAQDAVDADKLVRRWMAMIDYAYQCRDDIRSSSGETPRSGELRLLADEMRAAISAKKDQP